MSGANNKTGKRKSASEYRRDHHKATAKKKLMLLLLATVLFFAFNAIIVEAGPLDTARNAWGNIRIYVLNGAFWINAIILFGAGVVIYSLLLAKHMGSGGGSQQNVIYVVIGLIAIVLATKIVGATGAPEYLWRSDKFTFLLGPNEQNRVQTCGEDTRSLLISTIFSVAGVSVDPPCCGVGAYYRPARQGQTNRHCKQAILRTNENGSGLPAMIIATLMLYILFNIYSSNLGMDKVKWLPIVLSLILGAMIAHERISKNQILLIGGWITVIVLGNKLSQSLSGEKDKSGSKKGFGFGLSFAFVQLILNMLGTSLFGGSVLAGDVGLGSMIRNLFIGLLIGVLYSSLIGGGIFGRIMERISKEKEEEIKQLEKEGSILKPFMRALPIFGRLPWFKPKEKAKESKKNDELLQEQLNKVWNAYHKAEEGSFTRAQLLPTLNRLLSMVGAEQGRTNSDIQEMNQAVQANSQEVRQERPPQGQPRMPED